MTGSGTATRPEGWASHAPGDGDGRRQAGAREPGGYCWQVRDLPVRLLVSDLSDPGSFHRRLNDWLMQQR